MRNISLLIIPVIAVTLLAGCSGADPQPTATATVTESPSGSASASPAPAPAPSPSASTKIDPTAPKGQCADDALAVQVTGGDGAAGSITSSVVFTNNGSTDCVLQGAPGVSVVGAGDGTQLGASATQPATGTPPIVTLPVGGSAAAPLSAINITGGGGALGSECPVEQGDGYRVYPPHSFRAFFVPSAAVPACTGTTPWLSVQDVQAAG